MDGPKFTTDWFSIHIPHWEIILAKFKSQPNLRFLEIGSWEGRSALWLCRHVLTHESSHLECVDTFEGGSDHQDGRYDLDQVYARFQSNLKSYLECGKVKVHLGQSKDILTKLLAERNHYDVIYVDGSHLSRDTLVDAVLSWMLLSKGGMLIFDDYGWMGDPVMENRPKLGIDAFLACFKGQYHVIHMQYQVFLIKMVDY